MRTFKESLKMFKYNFSSILLFEIMFKLISAAVLIPFLYTILNLSVEMAGIGYLTTETMGIYFKAPSTYAFLFVIVLALAAYLLINVSGLIYAMEASHREEKISALVLLIKGIFNALRVINPKNMGATIYVLLVLPFTYTVMISGSLVGMKLPEFFVSFFEQNRMLISIVVFVYILLCVFSLLRIFSFNYYTLYKMDYREAKRLSRKIIKHNFIKVFVGLAICNLIINGIHVLLQGTLATAIGKIMTLIVPYKAFRFGFEITVQIVFLIIYSIFSIISTPLVYAYICRRFYELEGDDSYDEYLQVKEKRNKKRKRRELTPEEKKKKDRLSFWTVFVVALLLNGTYIYLASSNRVNLNIIYSTRADVTAHRGDSMNAPENTMAAIEKAAENQADIIEIDVRQTADGVYVLFHDEDLYRTTGVKRDVGECNYDFISNLDAGSYFSEEYAGEPIPTLEEALIYGEENNIFYNIELKPEDTDTNYVQGIMDLLEKYDYIDNCVVSSMNYETLKEVKVLNEDIETIYIISMVIGRIEGLEYADGFSIKHRFITADMVERIHKKGKKIFAWTVNDEENIKKLLLLDVDSIITDNPYETKEIIYNANQTMLADWINRLLYEY